MLKKKYFPLMLLALIFAALCAMTSGCGSDSDKYVDVVKNGTLQAAPDKKIGPAFENFFGDPKWKAFKSKEDKQVVEFTGKCKWQGQDADFKMQFIMHDDKKSFEVGYLAVNGQNMNAVQKASLLKKIFDGDKDS